MSIQAFQKGFVKRASEYGLNNSQITQLYKAANLGDTLNSAFPSVGHAVEGIAPTMQMAGKNIMDSDMNMAKSVVPAVQSAAQNIGGAVASPNQGSTSLVGDISGLAQRMAPKIQAGYQDVMPKVQSGLSGMAKARIQGLQDLGQGAKEQFGNLTQSDGSALGNNLQTASRLGGERVGDGYNKSVNSLKDLYTQRLGQLAHGTQEVGDKASQGWSEANRPQSRDIAAGVMSGQTIPNREPADTAVSAKLDQLNTKPTASPDFTASVKEFLRTRQEMNDNISKGLGAGANDPQRQPPPGYQR